MPPQAIRTATARPGSSLEEEDPCERGHEAQDQVDPAPGGDVELEDVVRADDEEGVVDQRHESLDGLERPDEDHEDGRRDGQPDRRAAVVVRFGPSAGLGGGHGASPWVGHDRCVAAVTAGTSVLWPWLRAASSSGDDPEGEAVEDAGVRHPEAHGPHHAGGVGWGASEGPAPAPDGRCRAALVLSSPGSPGSEELLRVELVDRDDAHPRQPLVEGTDVVLEVVGLQPPAHQLGEAVVAELGEPDDPDPAPVEEFPDLVDEVAVIADEQDVGVPVADGVEGSLHGDVDDLLVGFAGERHRPVADREQRLHERHRQLGGDGEEEESPHRLAVGAFREPQDPLPPRTLLGPRAPAEDRGAEGGVDVLTVDEDVGGAFLGVHGRSLGPGSGPPAVVDVTGDDGRAPGDVHTGGRV